MSCETLCFKSPTIVLYKCFTFCSSLRYWLHLFDAKFSHPMIQKMRHEKRVNACTVIDYLIGKIGACFTCNRQDWHHPIANDAFAYLWSRLIARAIVLRRSTVSIVVASSTAGPSSIVFRSRCLCIWVFRFQVNWHHYEDSPNECLETANNYLSMTVIRTNKRCNYVYRNNLFTNININPIKKSC